MEFGPDASGDGAPRRSAPHLWVPTGTCGRLSSSDNTSQRRRSEPHANSPRMNGWHSTAARLGNPLSAASPRRKWPAHTEVSTSMCTGTAGWRSASADCSEYPVRCHPGAAKRRALSRAIRASKPARTTAVFSPIPLSRTASFNRVSSIFSVVRIYIRMRYGRILGRKDQAPDRSFLWKGLLAPPLGSDRGLKPSPVYVFV